MTYHLYLLNKASNSCIFFKLLTFCTRLLYVPTAIQLILIKQTKAVLQ